MQTRTSTPFLHKAPFLGHSAILTAAIERLRSKAEYTSLPAYLLPDESAPPDLQYAHYKSCWAARMIRAHFVRARCPQTCRDESKGVRVGPRTRTRARTRTKF